MDHFASGDPIVLPASGSDAGESFGAESAHPHQINPDDSETVQMIKELLETRCANNLGTLVVKDAILIGFSLRGSVVRGGERNCLL